MRSFIWIDLETSGLSPVNCQIIEFACIITDEDFNELDSMCRVVKPKDVTFEKTAYQMHKRSGLYDKIITDGVPLADVEREAMNMIKKHEPRKRRAYLAGNNVHFDRNFLEVYMPSITSHLTSRHLDASALCLFIDACFGKDRLNLKKKRPHRALDDIRGSIEEVKFYRDNFLNLSGADQ